MKIIIAWLTNLDWVTIGAAALTFSVGFFAKQALYKKAIDTIGDVADLVNDYVKAQADGKVSPEETQELVDDIKHIVSDYSVKK